MAEDDKNKSGSVDPDDIASRVARLIQRNNNNPDEAIKLLMRENRKLRARNREHTETIEQLTKKQIPTDGVVVTKANAELLKALDDKKISDPKQLDQILTDYPTLTEFKASTERQALVSDAAALAGYNATTLGDLVTTKGLSLEIKEVSIRDPKDPKKVQSQRVPHVKKADGSMEELTTYAERDLKHFLPALRKDADADGLDERSSHGRADDHITFPLHSAPRRGTERDTGNVVTNVMDSLYESPFKKTT